MGTFLPEPKQRKSQRKVEKFLEISIKYFLKVIRKALRKTCHKPKGVGELTFQISAYIVDAVKRGSVILRDPSQAQDSLHRSSWRCPSQEQEVKEMAKNECSKQLMNFVFLNRTRILGFLSASIRFISVIRVL